MDARSLSRSVRIGAAALGVIALAIGLVLLAGGGEVAGVGLWLLVLGVASLTAAGFEQLRYQARVHQTTLDRTNAERSRSSAVPTDETLIDPVSGQRMRVWIDPNTGAQELRPES